MKKFVVNITAAAERDLAGVIDYLESRLGNQSAACKVLDEFEALIGILEVTPTAHPFVRDELLALAGYRWAWVSSYMAFFTVDEDARIVSIERVLHGRRNWRAIVGADDSPVGEA